MALVIPRDKPEDHQELRCGETKGQGMPDAHQAGALQRSHGWNLCIDADDVLGTWMVPWKDWPKKGSKPIRQTGYNGGQWQGYGTTKTVCTREVRNKPQEDQHWYFWESSIRKYWRYWSMNLPKIKIPVQMPPVTSGMSTQRDNNLLVWTDINEWADKRYRKTRIQIRKIVHSGAYKWTINII